MGAENPIFQKHVRSRLRREGLVPAAIGVAVSAGFLVWSAALTGNIRNGQALVWLLGLQGFLLFVLGSARVAGAIAGARDSGILDFHRISPVSPLRMAVGFMLGAPVREYALFAITLPVALALPALGYPHPLRIVVALLLLVCATLLYHCAAALIALEMPKARNAEALAVAFPLMAQVGGLYLSASFPIGEALGLAKPDVVPAFFGYRLGWIALALLHQVPLAAFLFAAVVRRMDRGDRPLFSRPLAIGFLAWIGVMLLGDTASFPDRNGLTILPTLFGTFVAAGALIWLITPDAGQLANAVRRHRKLGRGGEPDPWTDGAPNALPVLAATALVIGFTLGSARPSGLSDAVLEQVVRAVLFAGAGLVTWGFALQGFRVRFRRQAVPFLMLFLFGIWVVPVLIGTLLMLPKAMPPQTAAFFLALDPVAGIVLSALRKTTDAVNLGVDLAMGLSLTLAVVCVYWSGRQVRQAEADALDRDPPASDILSLQ